MQSNLHQLKYTHNIMKFKQVKLSEVANLFAGYPFKGNNYSDNGVRVVRGDNVTIGHLRWTIGKDKRWNEPFDQFEYYSLHENDIVIGMDGSRVGMNRAQIKHEDLPLLLAQRVACIRNNSNSIQDYLYYQIFSNNFVQYIKAIHTGTSIPHVSLKQIGDFGIPLPSLSDQRKIAGILSALDAKIENNNKINANLEAQAEALFKSWFVDFTPFKDQPFVDSELGPIPQGWKVGKLTDIAVYLNGLAMQKFPPQDIKDSFPVLKIKELGAGICDNSSDRCSNKVPKKYIIEDGDIIFSWSGTLMVDVWCGGQCGLNQHLFKVSSSNYPKWFYYHWTKKHLRDFIHIARDKAVTMGHIKRGHLDNALVVVPNNFILEKATHLFEPLLNMVISKRIENQRLAALRNTLLPKLMSGEIKL